MKFKTLDYVRLTVDLPEHALKAGDKGTVVDAFERPGEGYDVEFWRVEEKGEIIVTISPDQAEVIKEA